MPLRWDLGRTPGFTCCRKPQRGTSGGWRQSGASPCWALVLAPGCAWTPRPPRPTTAHRTTPPRLGHPPPGRTRPPRCRGGQDTASAAVASRHPATAPRARGAPPAVAPTTRDRTAPPRRRLRRGSRAGTPATATRLRGTGTPPRHRASRALRPRPALAWEDGGLVPADAERAASHIPCWTCPGCGGETRCAVGSLHVVAERRPASGGAPTRGETPSQVE